MDKKTTRFNIVHGDNEYEIPEECEAAEEAAEELAKTNLEEHYSFINLLSIAVIMLFACIFFISVSGSDTSSQSADEVHGDTKGRTEGLDKGWTEPGDFTGLKGSQRSPVLSPAKGAFHCGGLRSISGILREISRRLPQSDEAKGSPQQSD